MNAERFFNEHSLEEISKKTKISPISLRFIKNKEYEKIPRVKFIGFIKLIEREFNIDLSELIEEYDNINGKPVKEEIIQTNNQVQNKKEKHYLLYSLVVILLIISAISLYKFTKKNQPTQNFSVNLTNNMDNMEKSQPLISFEKEDQSIKEEINTTKNIVTSNNETTKEETKKERIIKYITIIPNEKVWYRATNLDTNKTYEFLTSKPRKLFGDNYYIKFGHGNVTIEYGDMNITPNTKKIVRILLKNGEYKYLKKGIR